LKNYIVQHFIAKRDIKTNPLLLDKVVAYLAAGYTLEDIEHFLSTGVIPSRFTIINRYEQPWSENGHWYPWWHLFAETVITLSLGGYDANKKRIDATLLAHSGPWERIGLMDLHKTIHQLKTASGPNEISVREFIDQMIAYSNLDEEVIRLYLLKKTPAVFHQVINEAFAKAPEDKEGCSAEA
jgi:hypothetical protein